MLSRCNIILRDPTATPCSGPGRRIDDLCVLIALRRLAELNLPGDLGLLCRRQLVGEKSRIVGLALPWRGIDSGVMKLGEASHHLPGRTWAGSSLSNQRLS